MPNTNIELALTFDDVNIVPRFSTTKSRSDIKLTTQFTRNYKIAMPIVAAPMDSVCEIDMALTLYKMGGVGIIHRFNTIDEQVKICSDIHTQICLMLNAGQKFQPQLEGLEPVIAAAVGANGDALERTQRLVKESRINVILIDVAHGHHANVRDTLKQLTEWRTQSGYKFDIIAGNTATAQAAADLEKWGADCVRVGVGGGALCTTRISTGVGVPQITAVIEARNATKIPLISDGGIRYPGDIAKALVAGADTVMVGSLLAGTDEAPGGIFITGTFPNAKKFKQYRGSASASIKLEKTGSAKNVEGTAKMVEYKGSVISILNDLTDGVRSAMSYVGVDAVENMRHVGKFVRITSAGLREAQPHLL